MVETLEDLGSLEQEDTTTKGIGEEKILGLEKEPSLVDRIYTTSADIIAANNQKTIADYTLTAVHETIRAQTVGGTNAYKSALVNFAKKLPEGIDALADLRVTYIPEPPTYAISATAMTKKE